MVSADMIRTVLGVIGNVTSMALVLSPVPTFYGIWKNKTVEQYSSLPYLAALLNYMMWLLYGLPAVQPHNMLIITMSVIGIAIELHYIALFLAYSVGAARRRVIFILLAEVAFVATVTALVLNLAHTHTLRSMVIGILCVFIETGMYAAPLSIMVIHTMVHWIQLWRFLLPEDQRECMVSGCNRLQMVAQDIFYQATWRPIKRLEDA
ncbi:hypothetical protein ACQ4PT_009938 [Festuca glaucescens]